MNHLKGVASIFPPMIITISSVSLMSGSQPRFPPGELSNMKPKSDTHTHTLETHRTSAEQRFPVRRLTDVDEVAMSVQHDVSIVSVLDLQQEQQQTVRSHATDEVIPRLMNTRERETEKNMFHSKQGLRSSQPVSLWIKISAICIHLNVICNTKRIIFKCPKL